jgi:4-hydroxy-tetrahydrodipicolinate synthase
MPAPARLSGVLCPVVTPFNDDLGPDPDRLVRQCRWLLSQGVGLAVFGTTGEGNSLSVEEKIGLLDRLADAGIDMSRLMPGTGCCALGDTVRLTRHAVDLGCAGVLMLPPFYYKAVSDDGLHDSYAGVIERVASDRLRVYLYHIPPVAQVGLSLDLVERLVKRYPETVVGIKDSSGDWGNTHAMLERRWDDFRVFAGSETFLLRTLQQGGAGCISATANINAAAMHRLFTGWQGGQAIAEQERLDTLRRIVQGYPVIPALKAILASHGNDAAWAAVRPPLVALGSEQRRSLLAALEEHGLDLPGLPGRYREPAVRMAPLQEATTK